MQLSNRQHERFAQGVAEGRAFNEAAVEAGYSANSANNAGSRLMRSPDIKRRVEELRIMRSKAGAAEIDIRTSEGRVSALENRWKRLWQVMDERASDPEMIGVPGGRSGLLRGVCKQVGFKENAKEVWEWQIDTGLLSEMRAHENQVAEEKGQKVRRTESYREAVSLSLQTPSQLNVTLRKELSELPRDLRDRALAEHPELSDVLDVEPEAGESESLGRTGT